MGKVILLALPFEIVFKEDGFAFVDVINFNIAGFANDNEKSVVGVAVAILVPKEGGVNDLGAGKDAGTRVLFVDTADNFNPLFQFARMLEKFAVNTGADFADNEVVDTVAVIEGLHNLIVIINGGGGVVVKGEGGAVNKVANFGEDNFFQPAFLTGKVGALVESVRRKKELIAGVLPK